MIKTLRITTVLAAILAAGFFVFPVVSGVGSDEEAEQFLKSPGAIDKFKASKGAAAPKPGGQVSPLVEQAKLFARYLNPPKPPPPPRRKEGPKGPPVIPRKATELTAPSTAQCKLIGISYFEAQPEMSLALLDITGKGLRWVRQDCNVGHLKIEQVQADRVVFEGSEGTFDLVPQRVPKRSLLKGESGAVGALPAPSVSPVSMVAGGQDAPRPSVPVSPAKTTVSSAKSAAGSGRITPPGSRLRPSRSRPRPEPSPAELDKFINEVKTEASENAAKAGSGGTTDEADTKALLEFLEAARVSLEEAEKLDDLGRELDGKRPDPNRPKSPKTAKPGDSGKSDSP